MRIIAGKYRSRPLRTIRGLDLRPTSDRLRETLFDVLTAGNPEALAETVWLDLYAGTGAVGIEALSRGARSVYFVESTPRGAALIRENLASLKIETESYEVLQREVNVALRRFATSRGRCPRSPFLRRQFRRHCPAPSRTAHSPWWRGRRSRSGTHLPAACSIALRPSRWSTRYDNGFEGMAA